MASKIERNGGVVPVEIVADGSGRPIPFGAVCGAILIVEEGDGTIEWCVIAKPGSEPAPLFTEEAQPCTMAITAGNSYELPHAVYAAPFLVGRGADVKGFICVKG
jgi:hypothetical protein